MYFQNTTQHANDASVVLTIVGDSKVTPTAQVSAVTSDTAAFQPRSSYFRLPATLVAGAFAVLRQLPNTRRILRKK